MRASPWLTLIVIAACGHSRPAPQPIASAGVAESGVVEESGVAGDWLAACRARFATEGKRYASDAPAQFPRDSGYRLLMWNPVEPEDLYGAALVELFPGRSWHLYAIVADRSAEDYLDGRVPAFEQDGVALTEAWQDLSETYGGLMRARQAGSTVAVIRVETERGGDYDSLAEHPIASLFVTRYEAAIDACLHGAR